MPPRTSRIRAGIRREVAWVRERTSTGIWAIVDQGLFSGSNFIVWVLLARWMSPSEYGALVTSYAVFLGLAVIHTGMLAEPMVVFGSGRHAAGFGTYIRVLLREHLRLTAAAAAILVAAGGGIVALHGERLGLAVAGIGLASPCILLVWLARRACYVHANPRRAAVTSGAYLAAVAASLALLNRMSALSISAVQLSLAGAAIVAAAPVLWRMWTDSETFVPRSAAAQIRADHWRYGRWSTSTGLLQWIELQVWYLVLSGTQGLAASAELRAIMNLILPILQVDVALMGVLVPALVRARPDPSRFRHIIMVALAVFVTEAAVYSGAIAIFGPTVLKIAIAGRYTIDARVVRLLAVIPVWNSLSNVLGSSAIALEQPRRVFRATAAGAAVAALVGTWATANWVVAGAVIGMLGAFVIQALVLSVSFTKFRNAAAPFQTLDRAAIGVID